jgi:hypothetical protein
MSEKLKFISRHEPTEGQQLVVKKLGYKSLEKTEVIFGDDPVADLSTVGIKPTVDINLGCECTGYSGSNFNCFCSPDYWVSTPRTLAGVFPLDTALKLLRAGFELVVFTNSKSSRADNLFICTGADVLTLEKSRHISLSEEEMEKASDSDVSSRLFVGSRAIQGGV